MNKYHRPKNCEHLTKVRVNQAVWDNLSPAVRSQDLKLQKVQTSLFQGLCALTSTVKKLLGKLSSIPSGNEILQEATDAFALIANANLELNQKRRELMKPDLHNDYKHLCSSNSSVTITDQLFGNDLAKEVKELTGLVQHRDHVMTQETLEATTAMTKRDVAIETTGRQTTQASHGNPNKGKRNKG